MLSLLAGVPGKYQPSKTPYRPNRETFREAEILESRSRVARWAAQSRNKLCRARNAEIMAEVAATTGLTDWALAIEQCLRGAAVAYVARAHGFPKSTLRIRVLYRRAAVAK